MTKISRDTLFHKRIFPVLWFGLIVLGFGVAMFAAPPRRPPLVFALPLFIMVPIGYLLMRTLVFDLADEVYDCGDHLVVNKGAVSESVPFSNIMNVSATLLVNPPRITLRLIRPGRLGQEISFMPQRPMFYNPFGRNAIADDLIERAYRARRIS